MQFLYYALFAAGKNTVNEPHVLDCGKYAGMTTLEARKAILADLKEGGFLKEIEPLKHEVGTCYRCVHSPLHGHFLYPRRPESDLRAEFRRGLFLL